MDPTILQRLRHSRVVPVVVVEDPAHALPLADALLDGGVDVIEVTFRSAGAAGVIRRLRQERPALCVGAGTIVHEQQLAEARAAGAAFAFSPGLDPVLVAAAARLDFSYVPGVLTPSEFQQAIRLGVGVMKFFPAARAGGLPALRGLLAAFGHHGPGIVPTGGIAPGEVGSWLEEPAVVAVGGTWIAPREALRAADWDGIRERARQASLHSPGARS